MYSNPLCPKCKTLMRGPLFEARHRYPDRLVYAGENFVARANCYYQCEKCKAKMVFDPNWDENTRDSS